MTQDDNQGIQVKIALFGRSGVGKTSIITALWNEAKQLLADSPVKIAPFDNSTEAYLNENQDRLQGSFYAGTFNHVALPGNVDEVQYGLMLTTSGTTPVVRMWTGFLDDVFGIGQPTILFGFKDYPGGWVDPRKRAEDQEIKQKWKEYLTWISASSVLIVPVNANHLMEAERDEDRVRVPTLLGSAMLREVLQQWSVARVASRLPGLLVFAPIRCESYFDDNRNTADRSEELHRQFLKLYGEHIRLVEERDEEGRIRIEYHPIDTVGSVRVGRVEWPGPESHIDTLPNVKYEVIPPGTYSPLRADDLLSALSRHMLEYWEREKQLERGDFRKRRGIIGGIIDAFGWGSDEDRDLVFKMAGEWVGKHPAFKETLDELAKRSAGGRVVVLKGD